MKKIISIIALLLAIVLVLCACAPAAPDNQKETDPPKENSEANGEKDTKGPEEKARVALIVVGPLGADNNADDMYDGLKRAEKDLGVEVTVYEALEAGVYEESVRSFAQEGYDLVIGAFGGMCTPMEKVAADFPDTTFCVNYAAGFEFTNKNVSGYDYACWESNYVCGVLAGLLTSTGKLGHITGGEDANIIANYNAYVKGAQSVYENPVVERVNANTFTDAAKGKEIALSLYSKGIDVILGDAANTTLGMIEAGVETGNYIIGDAVDHSAYGPGCVVMDTALGFGNGVYDIVRMYLAGELDGSYHYANYANDGIGTIKNKSFAENCADKDLAARMPEIWDQVEAVEEEIRTGKLIIEKDITQK